jgi:hypothetical protein
VHLLEEFEKKNTGGYRDSYLIFLQIFFENHSYKSKLNSFAFCGQPQLRTA